MAEEPKKPELSISDIVKLSKGDKKTLVKLLSQYIKSNTPRRGVAQAA